VPWHFLAHGTEAPIPLNARSLRSKTHAINPNTSTRRHTGAVKFLRSSGRISLCAFFDACDPASER
jgi:hypothetical protein